MVRGSKGASGGQGNDFPAPSSLALCTTPKLVRVISFDCLRRYAGSLPRRGESWGGGSNAGPDPPPFTPAQAELVEAPRQTHQPPHPPQPSPRVKPGVTAKESKAHHPKRRRQSNPRRQPNLTDQRNNVGAGKSLPCRGEGAEPLRTSLKANPQLDTPEPRPVHPHIGRPQRMCRNQVQRPRRPHIEQILREQ